MFKEIKEIFEQTPNKTKEDMRVEVRKIHTDMIEMKKMVGKIKRTHLKASSGEE